LWPVTNLAGTPYALSQGVGEPVPEIWILLTGFWVDFARWYDNETWVD
jgi:hypothetical protein